MPFPANQPPEPTVPVSIRLPAALLEKIDNDVQVWNKSHPRSHDTRSDRIIYLLEYAYDAGTLNQFIDQMKAQYMNALATTPEALRAGAAGFGQVERMADQVNYIETKLDMLLSRP
jgi:hypothetical protein